jgi:hypothetical protein
MRSPTKQSGTDRRSTERRASDDRRADTVRAVKGERRVVEQRGVVTSMVDALEDILKWERASERAMRVATENSTTELDPSN